MCKDQVDSIRYRWGAKAINQRLSSVRRALENHSKFLTNAHIFEIITSGYSWVHQEVSEGVIYSQQVFIFVRVNARFSHGTLWIISIQNKNYQIHS